MSYASRVMGDGPLAYYRLGETSGTTAKDSTANAYNGTLNGTVTLNQAGALKGDPNGSMLFDGTSGYVSLPTSTSGAGLSSFSVECWFYLSNVSYATYPRIVTSGYAQGTNQGFDIVLNASGAGLNICIGNGTTFGLVNYSPTLTASKWYYLASTWGAGTITLYINAVSAGTASLTGTMASAGTSPCIGKDSTFNGQYIPGRVDEVAVYNKVLTPQQITTHYNAALSAGGMFAVARRPFGRVM